MAADVQIHIGAMLDDFNKAIFDAKTKLTGLGEEMDKAFARMDKASKNVTKLGESLSLKLTAPLIVLGGLAAKSFGEAAEQEMKLDAALASAGDTTAATKDSINKLADELKDLAKVDDDVTKGLVEVGLSMGLTIPQSKAAAKDAVGLSKAFKVDLDSALRLCAQAYQGNVEKLGKYIPALKSAGSEAEKQAIYQKAMAAAFDQAKASADSPIGSYERYKMVIDDLGKGIGKFVVEYGAPFLDMLAKIIDNFNNADESTKKLVVTVAVIAAAIGPLLIIIGKAISLYKTISIVTLAFSAGLKGNSVALGSNTASLAAHRFGIIAHAVATKAATAAQWLFNAACAANPIALIGIAAVAAAGSIALVTKRFMESREETKNLQKTIDEIKLSKIDFGSKEAADSQYEALQKNIVKMKESGKTAAEIISQLSKWHDQSIAKYNASADKASQEAKFQLNWANATSKAIDQVQSSMKKTERAQRDNAKEWYDNKTNFREQMSEYMKKAGRDELELEEIRYQDECLKYKDALSNKFISSKEYWDAIDKLEDDYSKNSEKIERDIQKKKEDTAAKWESTWKSAFNSNTDISEKFRQIDAAVADKTLTGWQGTAAKIAATFSSAFSAVSNVMNALFSAQTQAAEKKYSKLSAEEEAYQAYQDQQSAKDYARMSSKEKKESKLQEAANKAQIKRENELARVKTTIARKQAMLTKVTGIAEAGINTALGVTRAWVEPGGIAGQILAGLIAVMGAAQIAAIAATPLPSTSLAWGGATTGRTVAEIGEAGREVVMPLDSQYGRNAIGILVDKMWAGLEARASYVSRNIVSASSVQQQLAAASSGSGSGATELSVTLMLDSIKMGEVITTLGDRGYYRIPARIVYS